MKRWIAGPLSAAVFALAGWHASAQTPSADDFEKKYEAELARAAETGALMYRLDRAAWVATDEVLSRDRRAKRDKRMRGYIVDESDGTTRVLFVGMFGNMPRALYEVAVEEGKIVRGSYRKFRDGRELTEHQGKLYTALDTARTAWTKEEQVLRCAENVNTIAYKLEDGAPAGYRVYLLSATTKPDIIIAGGHYRFEVNEDADEVLGIHGFTNTCFNIPKAAGRKKGEVVAGLLVTYLKAPHPEEIHVFLSLNYGLPFFVMTTGNGVVWNVEGRNISADILPDDKADGVSE